MKRGLRAAIGALTVLVLMLSPVLAAEPTPAVAAVGAERRAAEGAAAPMQFAILGDRTGGARAGVFERAVACVNLLAPDFVMSVGDYIEGNTGDESAVQAQWEEFVRIAGRLEAPLFLVPGNHDISNPTMARIWRERFGPAYYHFVRRGVLFLCLSTEDPARGRMSAEQAEFVAGALEANRDVRWTLVFLHQPLWHAEERAKREGKEAGTGWPAIEALLADRPYTVFAGHTHTYTYEERQGREFVVVATCGGASFLAGPALGQFDHVTWVTMADGGPRIAVLPLDGIYENRGKPEPPAETLPAEGGRERLQPAGPAGDAVAAEADRRTAETVPAAGPFERR